MATSIVVTTQHTFGDGPLTTYTFNGSIEDPTNSGVLSIPTGVWTSIDKGALTGTLNYVHFFNQDLTNFIDISSDVSGTPVLFRLEPGQNAIFPCGAGLTAFWANADTAACLLEYHFFEA